MRWELGGFRRAGPAREVRGLAGREEVRLLKPWTYMNRSGAAVTPLREVAGFDPATQLLVLVDDVALPLGEFRVRAGGSAGGHNGLKSIEGALRSQAWGRLRIGVGPRPEGVADLADWVLGGFTREERLVLDALLDAMADAVECWIVDGIDATMNRFNAART